MEQLNLNEILNRNQIKNNILDFLKNFHENKSQLNILRGIYLFGECGIGKTHFVKQILKEANYDIIYYDASDSRNKNIIENISKHNMSDTNVLSMFHRNKKKIVIIMDEIDGMNSGDKGGINNLIKLIRPKKRNKG
jgi:replication factor C subunit 1